jgi:tRNA(Ile)-lysidine synthase
MARGVFQATILKHDMLCVGDGVVAALSGGPDSTALLFLLLDAAPRFRLRIHAAHFNHGLRGRAADEDEAFVRQQCRRLEVPFSAARPVAPPKKGENVEQWAREARYRFLEQVRAEQCFPRIALGHTRDDLVETFLMRLIRGSGLSGLACLRPVREGGLIRPMIGLSRADVQAFLAELGEPYREDSSNMDLERLRNRVRHELLPLLQRSYNPRIMERLAVTATLVRDDEDQLQLAAARELTRLSPAVAAGGPLELSRSRLCRLPTALARRAIRMALRQCRGDLRGYSRGHVEAVLGLAAPGGSGERCLDLPGHVRVLVSYDRLVVQVDTGGDDPAGWSRSLEIPGRTLVRECGLEAVVTIEPDPDAAAVRGLQWPDIRKTVLLDEAEVRVTGLTLRSIRPGDRYCPAGAPGRRKISRMLIDDHVPRHRRLLVPVLTAGEKPIWLPGRRPAHRWCWRPGSHGTCLRLELRPLGEKNIV